MAIVGGRPDDVSWALERMCRPLDDSILPSTGATASGDARCMEIIRDYIFALEEAHRRNEKRGGLLEGIRIAAEIANGVEPQLLDGMSERYVSIYCTARRDASDLIKNIPFAPCDYCGDDKLTGLPDNACENCMNTGLQYPEFSK